MTDFADLNQVEAYLGREVFARGRAYAANGHVLRMRVESERGGELLRGAVVGNGGLYETSAYVIIGRDGRRNFAGGTCSCPVGEDCKHVAALIIAAGSNATPTEPPRPKRASWDDPLVALVGGRTDTSPGALVPLAIEVWLEP